MTQFHPRHPLRHLVIIHHNPPHKAHNSNLIIELRDLDFIRRTKRKLLHLLIDIPQYLF
ncbi:Protein of unknown function [Pyronema omphalodes CBS 100304]|uniref:Uncharacterized protein n=1 Tax=Pyronema omphalodes (strain CBS 100304) TaxID=1076935 RepID=U4L8H8_PYROM|nr:Protein of unknown function [Pyronema omphalodes CBS 100304]